MQPINLPVDLSSLPNTNNFARLQNAETLQLTEAPANERGEMRKAFDDFVGQTFYSQLLGSMRKTVGKSKYFHGGRAEEVFQGQLDQVLAERMTEASSDQFTGPMFELFKLNSLKQN